MGDSIVPKRGGLRALDAGLVVAGVAGVVLVALWVLHAVVGMILFGFKLAIIVVAVAVAVRALHHFTRSR